MAEAAVIDIGKQDISKELEEKRDVIKNSVAKKANKNEFEMFMHLAKTYQLDPFQKEIFFWKYKGDTTIMTSRDGYLKIANRHPEFDGLVSDVIHENDDFKRTLEGVNHSYGTDRGGIIGAYALVYRKDRGHPIYMFAPYSEYKANKKVWNQYPSAMILKVAESMALKRAFSVSGLVSREEMEVQEAPDNSYNTGKTDSQNPPSSKDVTPSPEKTSSKASIETPGEVKLPGGKYEDKKIKECNHHYLEWIVENMIDNDKWEKAHMAAKMYLEEKNDPDNGDKTVQEKVKEKRDKYNQAKEEKTAKEDEELTGRNKEVYDLIGNNKELKWSMLKWLKDAGAEKLNDLEEEDYKLLFETLKTDKREIKEVDEAVEDIDDEDLPF